MTESLNSGHEQLGGEDVEVEPSYAGLTPEAEMYLARAHQRLADAGEVDRPTHAYVSDLVVRGQVAPADADELEPGKTHQATGEVTEDGQPVVKRRRFSAF